MAGRPSPKVFVVYCPKNRVREQGTGPPLRRQDGRATSRNPNPRVIERIAPRQSSMIVGAATIVMPWGAAWLGGRPPLASPPSRQGRAADALTERNVASDHARTSDACQPLESRR